MSILIRVFNFMKRISKRLWIRLYVVYRCFVPKPLTASEKHFIQENAAFWREYTSKQPAEAGNKYILVQQSNSLPLLCNASLATIVSLARNLRPLFIINPPQFISSKKILRSYRPDCAFVSLNSWRYLLPRVKAAFQAIKTFRALKSPGDILSLRVDGIRYGDLVYDTVLSKGYATVSRLDWKLLSTLYAFFCYRNIINDIIRRYELETSVFSSTVDMAGGTFSRHLLQHGIEVLLRTGSYQLQLKKYHSSSDIGVYPLRMEPGYFSFLMGRRDDTVLKLADSYLEDRFNQDVKHAAVDLAFDRNKQTYESKDDFCTHFGLDPARKTVFVMLHAFNDYPHSHFTRPMIFQDYYDWFIKTLEIAKSQTSVNWVFKEHPAAEFYPTRDVSLEAIFAQVPSSHIRFLNYRADFNSRSLRHIADAVVTCLGTAGLEYSCLGVPCVLAGESPYSGFGFTIEPQDAAEYEEQLRHIHELPRLNENQVKAAKLVMFFQLGMMQGAPYTFCPYYDYRQIRGMYSLDLWGDAAELIRNGDKAEMQRQVGIISDFINNPSYTQFINLDKYDFMRGGVVHEDRNEK